MTELPPAEWSKTFGGDVPEPLSPIVSEVVRLVRSLSPKLETGGISVPDRARAVTILGGRGTGKSTALRFALRALRADDNCLVLPVIDPESFGPGDSLAGWALAHIQREVTESERAHRGDDEQPLGIRLQNLARAQAVRTNAFVTGLERRGLTWDDFARDAAKVPMSGVMLGSDWAAALEHLAAAKGDNNLQVVVAVDDADLAPQWIASIVSDAQFLGASPRVALIFAADRPALRQSLQIAALNDLGEAVDMAIANRLISPEAINDLVGRTIVKYFPRSLRVTIEALPPQARLDFRPLGAGTSLLDLLSRLPLSVPGCEALIDVFQIKDAAGACIGISRTTLALSDNARDLRQLHEALEAVAERSDDGRTSAALELILRHGLETAQSNLPEGVEPVVFEPQADGAAGVRFDFSQVRFGKTTSGSTFIYTPLEGDPDPVIWGPSMSICKVVRHYMTLRTDQPVEDAEQSPPELPSQVCQLMFLAWEMADADTSGTPLRTAGTTRALTTPGGTAWQDQISGHDDQTTWAYWTVPDWQGYTDYAVYMEGWTRIHHASWTPVPPPGRFELVEACLLHHLWLVVSVQLNRRVPVEIAEITRSQMEALCQPDAWLDRRSELLELIRAGLVELVAPPQTGRDSEFGRWVDLLFPLHASRLFCSAELSSALLDLWFEVVPDNGRATAAEWIASIASEHVDRPIGDADIELLARLDESRAATLRGVRSQLAREREGQQAALLSSLQSQGIPPEQLEALRTTGATRELVIALYASGIRPEVITQLATLFPPPTVAEPGLTTPDLDAE
jgi:hypothetical protein